MTSSRQPTERQKDDAALWVANLSDPHVTIVERQAFQAWLDEIPVIMAKHFLLCGMMNAIRFP